MASTLRELIIKISANSSSYQSEIARASRMGSEYYKTMQGGSRKAEAATRQSRQALSELNSELVTVKESARGMISMFAGAFAIGSLISTADQYGQLSSRIKIATGSQEEYNNVQQRLMEISDRTYKSIEEQSELYIRTSNSMKELGFSTEGTLDFIDSISSSLTTNAASAEKGQSAIDALSKSMVKGTVSGLQWNTILAVMPTLAGDIARYLGTTEIAVKKLATSGKLSMDTFAKATIAAKNRNAELAEAMPTSVGDAITKLSNHWKRYVGDANTASGVTASISSAISRAADNIDVLVAAGAGLAGLGLARYFGGLASGVGSATVAMAAAYKGEVALATAQVRGTQISTARARAAVYRAQQAVASAVGVDKQTAAERRLSAAQATLSRNVVARAAAQAGLNNVTSVGMRLGSGLLSVVGGIPGIVLGVGAAWLYTNQKNEQARKTAIAYGDTVQQVRAQLVDMSIAGLQSTSVDASKSIVAQQSAISETEAQIRKLTGSMSALKKMEADSKVNPWMTKLNTLLSLDEIQQKIVGTQGELNQANYVLEQQTERLRATESLRTQAVSTAIDKTVLLTGAVGSLSAMYSQLNSVTGLATGQSQAGFSGMQLPELNSDQAAAMQKVERDRVLAELNGAAKVSQQARYEADDLKLPPGRYESYVAAKVGAQNATDALTASTKAQQKAGQEASSIASKSASVHQQYQQAVANLNKEIQVESVRLGQGDAAASLFAASIETSAKYTDIQRSELERLNKTLTESKQRWEDHNAAIASDPYRAAAESQRKSLEQLQRQEQGGEIQSARELYQRKEKIHYDYLSALASANQDYAVSSSAELAGAVDPVVNLQNQLARQKALYETYYANEVISKQRFEELMVAATNQSAKQQENAAIELYRSQSDLHTLQMDLISNVGDRTANMVTGVLSGQQSFSEAMNNMANTIMDTVVKAFIQAQTQALMFQMVSGVSSSFGGGASSGAANNAFSGGSFSGLSFNAKGGVYDSPSLSAYSGQVVSSPTLFAFAKGAGVMGEAGPEAIMPLTRAADGSLGVRSVSARQPDIDALSGGGDVGVTQTNHFNFTINGSGDQALIQAMETAAKNGAAQAKAELLKDLRTNGPARRTLGV
ncbi:phage tail tape measure protein [Yersinia pseudotuberculosis]|uniref:tape measure protein n=1 Tax=Yersinia pseudotuberculosis TaxID=633 RepID=UPI0005E4DCC4|nr:tape measure protein [Yersinia pseudotuberculosis]CNL00049.1 Phage-related minor tail protein [Yersinia pseudotuberculosis]